MQQQASDSPVKKAWNHCAYERPTDEKRAFGFRMRAAREMAQIKQAEAAQRLGYAQAVQLSNMESGNRPVPLDLLIKAAVLYGTTTDYLCGLADDPDRDPASAAVRHVSGRVSAEVNKLIHELAASSVMAVRQLQPDAPRLLRIAHLVLKSRAALGHVRQSLPGFDEQARGGAALLRHLDEAASLAEEHVRHAARVAATVRGTPTAAVLDAALPQAEQLPDLLRRPFRPPSEAATSEGSA